MITASSSLEVYSKFPQRLLWLLSFFRISAFNPPSDHEKRFLSHLWRLKHRLQFTVVACTSMDYRGRIHLLLEAWLAEAVA